MRTRKNRVYVHLTDKELKQLNAIVEKLPYNRERYIREAILGGDVYVNPPAEYGQIVCELRAIGSNVHQLLLKAIQIKFIDEVMVCDLYNTVLDMDEKFTSAFSSKRSKANGVTRAADIMAAPMLIIPAPIIIDGVFAWTNFLADANICLKGIFILCLLIKS